MMTGWHIPLSGFARKPKPALPPQPTDVTSER